jgi:hypothetical protein
MTKKLMTLAVATAFTGSAMAADVTVTGAQEWSYQNNNGATTSALDGNFSIKATTETDGGITASADINIAEDGANDGGSSITLAGSFGSIDLGDTSSAMDKIDDTTEWAYVLGSGSPSVDHAALLSLPTIVDGLSIHASMAADSNQDGNAGGSSVAGVYNFGIAKAGYAVLDNDDDTEATLVNASTSFGGLNLAYELHTDTNSSDVDTETKSFGATYALGATTFAVETNETSSAGAVSADVITYGVHQDLGSGLVAFVEQTSDDKDATADTLATGIAFKF